MSHVAGEPYLLHVKEPTGMARSWTFILCPLCGPTLYIDNRGLVWMTSPPSQYCKVIYSHPSEQLGKKQARPGQLSQIYLFAATGDYS